MKKFSLKTGFFAMLMLGGYLLCPAVVDAQAGQLNRITCGEWELTTDPVTGMSDISKNQVLLIHQSQPAFKVGEVRYTGSQLPVSKIEETDLNDDFGQGKLIRVIAATADGSVRLEQNYYLYDGKDYLMTDFTIESDATIESNYMAPLCAEGGSAFLPASGNRSLFVPYDNDKWVRYNSFDFGTTTTSYEVGVMYNSATRRGLVVGSVEHTLWKTGIVANTSSENKINTLEVYGGITSSETRDLLAHGAVKGKKIKSPKIFVGYFDDWRTGMETFGEVNAIVAPKLAWDGHVPFGWNSWGAIQTKLSYQNATEVSEYVSTSLQPNNYSNDNTVYIGLDSYWDNITYANLVKFVKYCKARGQKAGTYWTPFVDWAKNPDRAVEGVEGAYYRDIYLYADGKPQEIAGAYALDPTNPITQKRAELYLKRFKDQGFEYLKLDFMTHGSLESDSHYDPEVYTGIQAYNIGLQHIVKFLNNQMFLNFSISPLFPSNYANSRRIACDAYKSISETEYTLNSLTYGWWLNRVYSYNDADNVVFNGVSLGENRARMTSGVVTGMFTIGDDFSNAGYATAKQRAEKFLTDKEVIRICRRGVSFRPVEDGIGNVAADMFMSNAADTLYLAVFNYTIQKTTPEINFDRLGLEKGVNYVVHELWENELMEKTDSWTESIPRRDVKLFKIYPGDLSSLSDVSVSSDFTCYPNPCFDWLTVGVAGEPADYTVHSLLGNVVRQFQGVTETIYVGDLEAGVYLLTRTCATGKSETVSFIKQ